jgi:hypothetical protein
MPLCGESLEKIITGRLSASLNSGNKQVALLVREGAAFPICINTIFIAHEVRYNSINVEAA